MPAANTKGDFGHLISVLPVYQSLVSTGAVVIKRPAVSHPHASTGYVVLTKHSWISAMSSFIGYPIPAKGAEARSLDVRGTK